MGSYSRTCEIVEANEDQNTVNHSRRAYGSRSGLGAGCNDGTRVSKAGNKSCLEDDINQLFEAISLRIPSKGSSPSSQAGTTASALRKNAMKKAIAVGLPHSAGVGHSEPVSLKQALRDLSLSKASEMAAVKRLSMSSSSLGVSEAGRIKSLFKSVVVESSRSDLTMGEDKGTTVQVSLVPEDCKSFPSKKIPLEFQMPKLKSSNQSVQSSPRFQGFKSSNQSAQSSPGFQVLKSPNQSAQASPYFPVFKSMSQSVDSSPRFQTSKSPNQSVQLSPRFPALKSMSQSVDSSPRFQPSKPPNQSVSYSPPVTVPTIRNCVGTTLIQGDNVITSKKVGSQGLKSQNECSLPSPRSIVPSTQKSPRTMQTHVEVVSPSRQVGSQLKSSIQTCHSSSQLPCPAARHGGGTMSRQVGSPAVKTERTTKEKGTTATSKYCSSTSENALEPVANVPKSARSANKTSAVNTSRKAKLHGSSSLANGNRETKLTRSKSTGRVVKPVIKHRISIKKKVKQGTSAASYVHNEGNRRLVSSAGQLVCQKCQCALNESENLKQESLTSFSASPGPEVSLTNMNVSDGTPDVNSSNCNRTIAMARTKKNSKSKAKGEFSQSSKSSLGDFSTSTSNSSESHAGRPSCSNRPHMSKDVRWEAIRHVKRKDGALSLQHFNLIKKLGCGDIGTVYLAELIGSNCLFAIKVMDNEFLARRKKMPRAQTEREILRMLDHPFLPTLYAQFTSDNLSCLVMEYCPGGDLHVLRQKQPGRSFSEPAARFYVAEVLLALEYLHMLGVIYRDLKPENILVREDGHIMLSDFDLSLRCTVSPVLLKSSSTDISPAKVSGPCTQSSCIQPFCIEPSCQVPCFAPRFLPPAAKARKLKAELAAQIRSLPQLVAEPTDARSNSFVGTHEYLAPEIIKGEGHGAAVDWWTFGIFLYELLYGRTPFKGSGNEETLANVVLQSLTFPDSPLISCQARDLIRGLLVKEPENRLGTEKGAAEIKQHPFFEGLNWALIRCAIPPELPDFYEYGVSTAAPNDHDQSSKYFEFKPTGEQLEFELF